MIAIQEALRLRKELVPVMQRAGDVIMDVYDSGHFDVQSKADDSPVTKADKLAHQIIQRSLTHFQESYPILSEEGRLAPLEERQHWPRYWLVDPLDGTKEFLNRTGEFTVNVALIEKHQPILGIVYVPASGECYFGGKDVGTWKANIRENAEPEWQSITAIRVNKTQTLKVVASRRHGSEKMTALLANLEAIEHPFELVNVGSSLKICLLAEGKADWYPRLAPTCEWDTAAAQAVLEGAGGILVREDFVPLTYNEKESLLNPYFHCFGDPDFNWRELL
jgi:3'(2'), 5'-bisphosphate nucleotidase